MQKISRGKRIRVFTRLFLGIVRDFYAEARITRKRGINKARMRMAKRHRARAAQFRETALKMGGVLIKLGQFLSSRVDVMPEEYIQELALLQDKVAPAPFAEVKQLIEKEFGKPLDKIYKNFQEESQAAASLGQVHEAQLFDGTKVAVKVQRPDIDALISIDSAIFAYLMEGVSRFTSFGKRNDIPMLVQEFVRTLGDELDFYREATSAIRFKKNFKGSTQIYIPEIYLDYTTNKVITLEHIAGAKINDYEELDRRGIDRSEVAKEVVQSYFKQVFEDGFFHADPHPGNLFVIEGPEITFVDFGMVGEIPEQTKQNLKALAIAVATTDIDGIVKAFYGLGFLRKGIDLVPVKNAIEWMIDNYASLTSQTLTFEDIEDINEDLKRIMRDQPFTMPSEYAFLGRALGTLNGLATGLDPHFNALEVVKPYVDKLLKRQGGNTDLILNQVKDVLKVLISLPKRADVILSKLEKGKLSLKVQSNDIVESIERLNRSQRVTTASFYSSFLLMISVALFYIGVKVLAYIVFAFGIVGTSLCLSFFIFRRKT